MAASAHGQLVASQVTTVTVDTEFAGIEVVNRSQTGSIWIRFDGGAPAIGGAGSFVVLGSRWFTPKRGQVTVKLISNENLYFSVERA